MGYRDVFNDIGKGTIPALYLWYGAEEYVKERALAALCEALISPGMKDLDYQALDGEEVGVEQIAEACDALPFMAKRRLVVVRDPYLFTGRRGTQSEQERLTAYLAQLPPSVCLVLYLRAGQDPDKRKAVYKAAAKHGSVVEFDLLKEEERARWVKREIAARRVKMDTRALHGFLTRVGTGMQHVSSELEKLMLYAGEGGTITAEMVERVTVPTAEERIFDMLDAVGRRELKKAMVSLDHLLAAGDDPLVIVSMLARQFRLMLLSKELGKRGVHPKKVAEEMGMAVWQANKYADQAARFTPDTLLKGIESCAELNHGYKNGMKAKRESLEALIAGLCQG
jgi:DNA polymerase-3 subunit delta